MFSLILGAVTVTACRPAAPVAQPAPAPQYGATTHALTPTGVADIRDSVRTVLERGLANRAYPGAFAVVGTRDSIIAEYGAGHLDWAPSPTPDAHTLWDLASLSKVIGMTTAMMQLVDEGRVDVDAPVQRYLPTWTGPNKEKVLVRHLLTHTGGLPPDQPPGSPPYDQITKDPDSIAVLMFNTPLDTLPGVRMVYSDIGAYILGRLVEQVTGQSLDLYLHDHVFEPLQMHETMYRPPFALRARIAPTELDTVERHRLVRGMVHDERAYYLGGVSAHAGLFSSGHDLARFARMYLNDGSLDGVRVLSPEVIRRFTTRQVEDRALGWQKPNGRNSAGHLMSENAFGHTGFTGTSIWIDPDRGVFIVLLTNRVDPTRRNNRVSRVRTELADAVMRIVTNGATSH